MDRKKELKETNWIYVFYLIFLMALVIKVILQRETLQPLPLDVQYITTIGVLFLVGKNILTKKEDK